MIPQRWHALVQLIHARFREFFREPEVLMWTYIFPIAAAASLGYAFSKEPEAPAIDIAKGSVRAEHMAQHLRDDRWKKEKLRVAVLPEEECKVRLKKGQTALYLIVHPKPKDIEYKYDPARTDSVQARYWVEAILSRDPRANADSIKEPPAPGRGSRYIDFLLPGLIGLNIMAGGLFSVGFALVDIRVRKLLKRMLATPMRHSDFLLSLVVSRFLLLLPEMTSLLLITYFWFQVPIEGSICTLFIVILIGASAFSGLGLLIACRTERIESMSGFVNMIMYPSYVFCGIFFSSKSFPDEAQPMIQALPLTQLNDALREVMLEGASLSEVAWRLAILMAYAIVCFALSLKWLKWQ